MKLALLWLALVVSCAAHTQVSISAVRQLIRQLPDGFQIHIYCSPTGVVKSPSAFEDSFRGESDVKAVFNAAIYQQLVDSYIGAVLSLERKEGAEGLGRPSALVEIVPPGRQRLLTMEFFPTQNLVRYNGSLWRLSPQCRQWYDKYIEELISAINRLHLE